MPFLKPLFDYNWAVAFLGGAALHALFSRIVPSRAPRVAVENADRVTV
ncbi:hypothetical protein OHA79_03990 [Streptomyces sp. NBC_00841]|nr:hypothetical protein [Streptomyces sp. NBC_00841]WRZ97147.1 hypothetical protein OHA79_03990 [Streptomyces sp. NBC_00841]